MTIYWAEKSAHFLKQTMEDLQQCDGRRFSAIINGIKCEGRISVERGIVYLCQNKKDGNRCRNSKGYDYSWNCNSGTIDALKNVHVSDFKLFPDFSMLSIREIALEKAKEFYPNDADNIDTFINAWELAIEWYKLENKL
jgi:hypothetical protein